MVAIGSGYTSQTYGLTGRKPKTNLSNTIAELSSLLPQYYATKKADEAADKSYALEEKGLADYEKLEQAKLAQSEKELEQQQTQWGLENEAAIRSFNQQKEIADQTAAANKKATTISNVLGGANVAANLALAGKGLGLWGGIGSPGSDNYAVTDVGDAYGYDNGFNWWDTGINAATGAVTGLGAKYLSKELGASSKTSNLIGAGVGLLTGVSGLGSTFAKVLGY